MSRNHIDTIVADGRVVTGRPRPAPPMQNFPFPQTEEGRRFSELLRQIRLGSLSSPSNTPPKSE